MSGILFSHQYDKVYADFFFSEFPKNSSGMGFTKTISLVLLFAQFFSNDKKHVT